MEKWKGSSSWRSAQGNSNAYSQIPCCWRKLMKKSQSQSDGNAAARQGKGRLGAGCSQDEDMECCCVPGKLGGAWECHPGVPSAELLLGKDTQGGLGPLPTWKLLSVVMRPVWESFYTAPGNVLSLVDVGVGLSATYESLQLRISYNSMQCYHFGFTLTPNHPCRGDLEYNQPINCHLFSWQRFWSGSNGWAKL